MPWLLQKKAVPRRSVRRQVKDPKRRKSKSPRRLFRRMEWKTHLSLFSKKKKYFSKEELISSDLEETAGTGGLPERKKSFPKEEPVTDPDESENKRVPKKKRKLSPKRSQSAADLKRLLPARAAAPIKRQSSESSPRKVRMDIFLVGHDLQRYSPSNPLEPNTNKNKFKKKKK